MEDQINESFTSFQEELSIKGAFFTKSLFQNSSAIRLNNSGGPGKTQTLNLRGFDSASVLTTLEGIPLSTPSEGYFNFGDLLPEAFESLSITRGGFISNSSSPAGQVELKLPRQSFHSLSTQVGSYQTYGASYKGPRAAISYRQSEGDFLFYQNDQAQKRQNNQSQNANLSTWYRKQNFQIWGQLFIANQNIPTDTFNGIAHSELLRLRPLVAYQAAYKKWNFDAWMGMLYQENESETSFSESRVWSSGQRAEFVTSYTQNTASRLRFEFLQDHLWLDSSSSFSNTQLSSEVRLTPSLSKTLLITLYPGHTLQPRLRIDYVSGIGEPFFVHPGIGGRHRLNEHIEILWNAEMISRAPTLLERYFESNRSQANPELERQVSLQNDAGWKMKFLDSQLEVENVLYYNRITNRIQFNGASLRNENFSKSINFGVENKIAYQAFKNLLIQSGYTYSFSKTQNRQSLYQPSHQLFGRFFLVFLENMSLDVSGNYRSVAPGLAGLTGPDDRIPEQWSVDMAYAYELTNLRVSIQAFNIFAEKQRVVTGFPLPQERYFLMQLEYRFI